MERGADRGARQPADSGADTGADSGADSAAANGVPGQLRAAVAVIALEALALVAVAAVLVVKTIVGDPNSLGRALLGAALALLGAVVLGLAARGIFRLRPAARTPVIVLELLALPVGYSLGFQAGLIGYGGPMVVAALAVLYLLFTPPAREALDRQIG